MSGVWVDSRQDEWKRMLAEYPWLAQKVAARAHTKAASSTAEAGDPDSSDESDGEVADAIEEILDEEAIEGIFTDLATMRDEWRLRFASVDLPDFTSGLLGGASTLKMTKGKDKAGVISDYVCCETKTSDARTFARSYNLQQSKRAGIERYGIGPATVLVEAWGHRMQFYLDLYRSSGSLQYTFTVVDHNSYEEPPAFTRLVEVSGEDVRSVAASIRTVMPFYYVKK